MIKQQFIDPLPILKKHICARDFDGLKYYLEDILSAIKEFAASQPPTPEPGKVVTGELYWKQRCLAAEAVMSSFNHKAEVNFELLDKWKQLKNQEVEPGQQKETFTND